MWTDSNTQTTYLLTYLPQTSCLQTGICLWTALSQKRADLVQECLTQSVYSNKTVCGSPGWFLADTEEWHCTGTSCMDLLGSLVE